MRAFSFCLFRQLKGYKRNFAPASGFHFPGQDLPLTGNNALGNSPKSKKFYIKTIFFIEIKKESK